MRNHPVFHLFMLVGLLIQLLLWPILVALFGVFVVAYFVEPSSQASLFIYVTIVLPFEFKVVDIYTKRVGRRFDLLCDSVVTVFKKKKS